ncbi:hypothetical protein RchiOBHm_Chr7g0233571 [Rosa chinensis]|uniref:Uncharacterized protein n=1 Tax=Rosa chinensis TaxID=74649 RepID=A0A2P6PG80_ROSCH|nr:hypothetical protein RchiOBHm_Chr7g0233571 [Rosa chinensis]
MRAAGISGLLEERPVWAVMEVSLDEAAPVIGGLLEVLMIGTERRGWSLALQVGGRTQVWRVRQGVQRWTEAGGGLG